MRLNPHLDYMVLAVRILTSAKNKIYDGFAGDAVHAFSTIQISQLVSSHVRIGKARAIPVVENKEISGKMLG